MLCFNSKMTLERDEQGLCVCNSSFLQIECMYRGDFEAAALDHHHIWQYLSVHCTCDLVTGTYNGGIGLLLLP